MLYYDIDGFHLKQNDTNTRYQISEEDRDILFQELNSRSNEEDIFHHIGIYPDTNGKPIVKKVERSADERDNILRRLRTNRVFPIINRSNMWFNSLTQQQKNELQIWYQAWLDVTDTLVVPDRPAWLD